METLSSVQDGFIRNNNSSKTSPSSDIKNYNVILHGNDTYSFSQFKTALEATDPQIGVRTNILCILGQKQNLDIFILL